MVKADQIPHWLTIALQELQADVEERVGPKHEPRIIVLDGHHRLELLMERVGPKHEPRIIEYHQTCSLKAKDDETPWCSAFVNWVMSQAGYVGTDNAAAASWRQWGEELPEGGQRLGCIVVMTRTGGNHVGFYLDEDDAGVYIMGGNQANQVCIRRYAWEAVTNFRWPKL